jgi:hypothetical protein
MSSSNKTGFMGVVQSGNKYGAKSKHLGQSTYLGVFDTRKEAARAYLRHVRSCGGEEEEEDEEDEEKQEEEEEEEEETEGFAGLSKDDRLGKERTLQMGKQSDGKVLEAGSVGGAKPHDNLESEYGSVY